MEIARKQKLEVIGCSVRKNWKSCDYFFNCFFFFVKCHSHMGKSESGFTVAGVKDFCTYKYCLRFYVKWRAFKRVFDVLEENSSCVIV